MEAQLNDKKIQGAPKGMNVSAEERKEYDKQARAVYARMKKQHIERQQNGNYGSRTTDKDQRKR